MIIKLDFEKAYNRINWYFLAEVLVAKGFSNKWVELMMGVVQGGDICEW
jgi:hypothetical protein